MNAGDICSRQVVAVPRETTVAQAARIMRGRHVGTLLVTNAESNAIGLVTDRDLVLDVLAVGGDANALTMNDLMSKPLICYHEDDANSDAIRTMRKCSIGRLPVVNVTQKPMGMLTLDDAMDHTGRLPGDLVGIMKSEFKRKKTRKQMPQSTTRRQQRADRLNFHTAQETQVAYCERHS